MVKKILAGIMVAFLFISCLVLTITSCTTKSIIIYTSTEDYTMELLQKRLDENFPKYDIRVEYMSTSNISARVIAEGNSSDCDIVFAEEYGYVEKMAESGVLCDLTEFFTEQDYSLYTQESLNTTAKNYLLPGYKMGGGIVLNTKVLRQRGLAEPTSYEDLTKPQYKGMISMPSPKSSATGYMFYLSLVNEWGEDRAVQYFNSLAPNVNAFTTSGSKPVNLLVQEEVAVGLGMLSQATEKITAGNKDLKIVFFEEGAPFNMCGNCIVKGKEEKDGVVEIMQYIHQNFTLEICEKFYPESIFEGKDFELENFPTNVTYADMRHNNLDRKEALLTKWNH